MLKDLKSYINPKNPLFQFFLFLSLFGLISLVDLIVPTVNPMERSAYMLRFFVVIMTSCVVYFMIRYGFGARLANPLNFLVSTWIVFLLIHPTSTIWYLPFAVCMIPVGKLLIRRNKVPVFNPAAFAIVLTTLVSIGIAKINPEMDTLLVSWWGTDMTQNIVRSIPVFNIIVPMGLLLGFVYFVKVFKKVPYALSFYITFLSITFVKSVLTMPLDRAVNLIFLMFVNATAFFAFVMLPEPKTSPIFPKQQIVVGSIAGITLFFANTTLGALPIDPLIIAILVANIATLISKIIPKKNITKSL